MNLSRRKFLIKAALMSRLQTTTMRSARSLIKQADHIDLFKPCDDHDGFNHPIYCELDNPYQ